MIRLRLIKKWWRRDQMDKEWTTKDAQEDEDGDDDE